MDTGKEFEMCSCLKGGGGRERERESESESLRGSWEMFLIIKSIIN